MIRVALALGVVATAASAAESELGTYLVAEDTLVRVGPMHADATLREAHFGQVIQVRKDRSLPPGVVHAHPEGFIDLAALRPLPAKGERRYVADSAALLFADTSRSKVQRSARLGEPLDVVLPKGGMGLAVVLGSGMPGSFVTADTLTAEIPTAAWFLQRAQTKLIALDNRAAIRALESALELEPGNLPVKQLLGAMLGQLDWDRSKKLLSGIPEPRPLPAATFTAPPETGRAWVLASMLRLRDQPSEKAKKRGAAFIGAEVVLEKRDGKGWAQIRTAKDRAFSAVASRDDQGGFSLGPPTTVPAVLAQAGKPGWVKVEHLTGEAPTLGALEQRAALAEAAGKFDEAFVWATRAQQLAPAPERLKRVLVHALRAQLWQEAGRAATVRWALTREGDHTETALDFAWGCSEGGDPRTLELIESSLPLTPPVCVAVKDTEPCEFCGRLFAEGVLTARQRAELDRKEDAEAKTVDLARKKFAADRAALRKKFPVGPFLKVRLDPEAAPAGQNAFLAVVDVDRNPFDPSVKLVEVLPVPALKPNGPGDLLDVWLPVTEVPGRRFDLFFAPSLSEAKHATQTRLAKEEPLLGPKGVNMSLQLPARECSCGC